MGWRDNVEKKTQTENFYCFFLSRIGTSVWWPNKDHMYDEVENMKISVNVPGDLTNVSNGRLQV
jgi:hypothetical protein